MQGGELHDCPRATAVADGHDLAEPQLIEDGGRIIGVI